MLLGNLLRLILILFLNHMFFFLYLIRRRLALIDWLVSLLDSCEILKSAFFLVVQCVVLRGYNLLVGSSLFRCGSMESVKIFADISSNGTEILFSFFRLSQAWLVEVLKSSVLADKVIVEVVKKWLHFVRK